MKSPTSQPGSAWRFPVRGTLAASVLTLAFLPVTEASSPQYGGQRQNPRASATPGSNRTNLAIGGGSVLGGGGMSVGSGGVQTGATGGTSTPTFTEPLMNVSVPMPPDIDYYIKDMDAAVRLGKAFFWDVQAGSDGLTACATCHNFGGTDRRLKNSVHPGFNGTFFDMEGGQRGPNGVLTSQDFPFHLKADPNKQTSSVSKDCDDVYGSAGVPMRDFVAVTPGEAVDQGTVIPDPVFNVGGLNVDQVTGRNSPTVINAVFNVRQFWDGRADFNFNGVNIWGDRDPDAKVLRRLADGTLVEEHISIEQASLASQAVGPALSEVEMSWHGRDFPALAKKLLPAKPLKLQEIHPDDLHLGSLSAFPERGMTATMTYEKMIRQAFRNRWWAGETLDANGLTQMERNFTLYWGLAIQLYEAQLVSDQSPYDAYVAGDEDALTEQEKRGMNRWFSGGSGCAGCHFGPEFAGGTWTHLFSDQDGAGVERMATIQSGQSDSIGFTTRPVIGGSVVCDGVDHHSLDFDPRGRTLEIVRPDTGEVVAYGQVPGQGTCNPDESWELVLEHGPGFPDGPWDTHELEPTPPAEFLLTVESTGDYLPGTSNCIVELTLDADIVADAGTPAGDYSVRFDGVHAANLVLGENVPNGVYDVGYYNIGVRPMAEDMGLGANGPFGPLSLVKRLQMGDPTVAQFNLSDPVSSDEYPAVHGAFRASSVRNIALFGPYMHNGSMSNLEQVVQFYARGADFVDSNVPDLHGDVMGVGALRDDPEEQAALVAFMATGLLDQRVARRSDVFCHPSLPYKEGAQGDNVSVNGANGEAYPVLDELPATGVNGVDFGSDEQSQEFVTMLEAGIVSTVYADDACLEQMPDDLSVMEEDGIIGCSVLGSSTDSSRTIRVFLGKKPQADVTISVSSSEGAEIVIDADGDDVPEADNSLLVFTSTNWFHPQEVRVKASGNDVEGDDHVISVSFGAAVSDDADFAGRVVPGRSFLVKDTSSETGVVHVDVNGTNEYVDGTDDYPFHSINEALVCGENLELVLAAGDYYEDIHIQGSSLVLRSEGGAVLHGSGNGPVVTVLGHEASGSELHGLEITGGNGQAGGVFVSDSAHALISNCVIRGNTGELAGGVACRNSSSVELVDSVVEGNSSINGAGGLQLEGGHADVRGTVFTGNVGRNGGAIYSRNGAPLVVQECELVDNAANRGGGIALEGGGLVMTLSKVVGNDASEQGGGIFAMNSASVEVYGSKVTNNSAPVGGGIYADGGLLDLVRSTIATNGEALYLMNSVQLELNSAIVWADGNGAAIGRNDTNNPLAGTVEHSLVDFNGFAEGIAPGSDPLFVDAAGGDHDVESGSPAIDAGDPSLDDDPDGTRADIGAHTLLGE